MLAAARREPVAAAIVAPPGLAEELQLQMPGRMGMSATTVSRSAVAMPAVAGSGVSGAAFTATAGAPSATAAVLSAPLWLGCPLGRDASSEADCDWERGAKQLHAALQPALVGRGRYESPSMSFVYVNSTGPGSASLHTETQMEYAQGNRLCMLHAERVQMLELARPGMLVLVGLDDLHA